MSKLSNLMRMLILLKAKGTMRVSELAEKLEVNERMVQTYKMDLLMAGIEIESKSGPYGGYSLPRQYDYLIDLNLNVDEHMALEMIHEQTKSTGFVYAQELETAFHKIHIASRAYHQGLGQNSLNGIYGSKASSVEKFLFQEREHCKEIQKSILEGQKIDIEYYSLSTDCVENRIIHPYAVYEYRNSLYVTGFCELRQSVRDFKLSRIRGLKETNLQFELEKAFSLREYMSNCLGIFKDQPQKVVLKILHPMSAIIGEKIWAEDQEIKTLELEKGILFKATLQGKVELVSWILSMGKYAIVIEPQSLKDEVKNEIKKMTQQYD